MADKNLRVRFEPPSTPPALLVVGDVTLEPGDEYDFPADLAQSLIDDPEMNVLPASDVPARDFADPAGEPGDDTPKET